MSDKDDVSELREMDEEDIPSSQVEETEPQSSCETFMSQQSENGELSEKPEDKVIEVSDIKSAETSALNSSLEANTSGGNVGSSYYDKTPSLENLEKISLEGNHPRTQEGLGDESQGDMFEVKDEDGSSLIKQQPRKRKGRSGDSTPSPKRLRKSIPAVTTPEQDLTPQPIDEHAKVQDISVMEISSTPEESNIIDDSQEFSLRIEENSPLTQRIGDNSGKHSEDKNSWDAQKGAAAGSAPIVLSPASSATASLSQKSAVSWASHNQDQNLSWGSHRDIEDMKKCKAENGEHVTQQGDSEKDSSSDSFLGKNVDNETCREVEEMRTLTAKVVWVIDSNNKVISAMIKQVSVLEDHPVERLGRMSTVSTTSIKSSSSSGSVGLPGPFPLPGRTVRSRLSAMSTVSSTTCSSSASNQAWDGPFLKPQVPVSKLNVPFSCEKCGHQLPPVDRHITLSPTLNGSPPVAEAEVETKVKSLTPKRGRKAASSESTTVSSGLLEEETSSSGSQPQACSTPTKLGRGRPKNGARKQNGTAQRTAKKEGSSVPARTPRTASRGSRNGGTQSIKKVEEGNGEPVLARWGGDGRYYPGWVADPLTGAQVLVRFCDGQSKPTAVGKVVRAGAITPGTLVLAATTDDDEYEEALVVDVDLSGAAPVYTVERDKTQREVKFPNIALQQSTVTELTVSEAQKQAAATNFNDLSLENIIAHPRKRSARTPVEGGSGRKKKRQTTPQPCTSHGQTYNGPDDTYGDTDSSTHSTCSVDLKGKEIRPLDVECFPPESQHTKLVYNRGHMAFKKKEGTRNLGNTEGVELLGPIPEPGSELFKDCVFLITYTDSRGIIHDFTYSSLEDTSISDMTKKGPLWRDRLRTQIINGGGKVYNSFSEVTKDEHPKTYLITDKPCNTPLYLQCLVNNIPIYSHSIVIQCCAQNRTWREMIASRGVKRMMAGYSLSRRCLVNPRSSTPLRGRTLLLALSGDASLSAFWQKIITKVGGSVDLYPHCSVERSQYDAIVTDAECDRELVTEACAHQVALVSMTWLQQVIITGEWRPPTEHNLYKYNVSGDGEGESPEY